MNTLKSTFGALAAGLVLASGCGQNPVLTGEYEGKRYTLNQPAIINSSSIVEEKTDANGKTRTEIYLPVMFDKTRELVWKDYSDEEGFFSKTMIIHDTPLSAIVSNSQGIATYSAKNPENKNIINQIHSNLLRGIVNVASNKTEKTQQKEREILNQLSGNNYSGAQQ